MSLSSRQHNVRLGWMDSQRADPRTARKAAGGERAYEWPCKLSPGGATFGRFEHSSPVVAVAGIVLLAGSNVDSVGTRRRNRDRAYGQRRLIVREWSPVLSAVSGFPNTTVGRAQIDDARIRGMDGERANPASRERRATPARLRIHIGWAGPDESPPL